MISCGLIGLGCRSIQYLAEPLDGRALQGAVGRDRAWQPPRQHRQCLGGRKACTDAAAHGLRWLCRAKQARVAHLPEL